jgi:membrane protease YdiL (CAAX protease family)
MVTVKKENAIKVFLVALFFPVFYVLLGALLGTGYALGWGALNTGATPEQITEQVVSASLLITVIAAAVFFLIVFLIFKVKKQNLLKHIKWNSAPGKSVYALSLLLILGLFLTVFLLGVVIPQSWTANDVAADAITTMSPLLVILCMGIIIPVAEEFVFRGLLMSRLQTRFAPWMAVTLTTVIFAVVHLTDSVGHIFTVLPFAMSVCLVFLWTKSIRVTMFIHVVYNTILVAVALLATSLEDPSVANSASSSNLAPAIMGLIGLAITVSTLFLIYKRRQKDEPDSSVMPSN